jgi:TetR/AcrR family transcriptional regulator
MPVANAARLGTRQRDSEATRRAILDAAERLLAVRGYRAMTVDALAAEADVAVGTIYGRFGGKAGVLLALADRLLDANEAMLREAAAAAADPLGELLAMSDAYLEFHRTHPLAFRVVGLTDLEDPPADGRARIAARLDALLDLQADALRRSVRLGAVRDVPAKRTVRLLWAATNGLLALHARGGIGDRELRASLELWRSVWLDGLRPAT